MDKEQKGETLCLTGSEILVNKEPTSLPCMAWWALIDSRRVRTEPIASSRTDIHSQKTAS